MAEVEPIKIDVSDKTKRKLDGSDQKKRSHKRKRLEPCLYAVSPEEKQAKIEALRDEIDSLVKFAKDLAFRSRLVLLECVEKVGLSSASVNCVIACLMEESDLPFSMLVDEIFEEVKGRAGNGENVTRASVKSSVLMIGQRLCYGVASADADLLEDEAETALWFWETRDLKLIPKSERVSVKVRRTCRKKIQERIAAVTAMINALEKSGDHPNHLQDLTKASEKIGKVLNEADIRLLMENILQKNAAEMAEKDVKKEEKMLIKQMEKNKQETEKAKKKRERELQKEMLQNEKEQKRLREEAEKEERRREKEENDMQKLLNRQQEEAEKDQKRKAKEEAELKKQLALQKQASLMEQFFKRKKSTSFENNSSSNKGTTSMPSPNLIELKCETVIANMDSVLVGKAEVEAEAIWKSHLNSWRCIGNSIRSKKVHWGMRQKPKTELVKELKLTTNTEMPSDEVQVEEKNVDGLIDPNIHGRHSQMTIDRPLSQCRNRKHSRQLLQFDKSHRPAFYSIWPKKSQAIGGRCPLVKDPLIDYEIDSDEEWEEEEPGESLSDCEKDEDDESMEEQQKFDDEDESEDGFFVPDGYLSESEGVQTDVMECDELAEEVGDHLDTKEQVPSEEFCSLLRQQKYLNNMTEHALRKNQPLIILNFMHEKTTLSSAEELSGSEKLEKMCLQALCIRPLPDFPATEISICNNEVNEDLEPLSNKSSSTPPSTAAATTIPDSDMPQFISIINSCPHGIAKISDSLHNTFPAFSKSQLRNKVREISEFSENRWQVKKEILRKFGLSISPERKSLKAKSIASFFSKRCLPPSKTTTMNLNQPPPQLSEKHAAAIVSTAGLLERATVNEGSVSFF